MVRVVATPQYIRDLIGYGYSGDDYLSPGIHRINEKDFTPLIKKKKRKKIKMKKGNQNEKG